MSRKNQPDTGGPPRLAEWLLDRSLPPGTRGRSIKGDLDQELDELRARTRRGHTLWYTWEATKLAVRFGLLERDRHQRKKGIGTMERTWIELRHAARRLRKNPGFAFVAIATLALGIGANVAIFSVVNAVVFAPLPYDDADRLVAIWEHRIESGNETNVANPGNVKDWRDRNGSFVDIASSSMMFPLVFQANESPIEVQASFAEPNFFAVLGLRPEVGRDFASEATGSEALLAHAFWEQEFGSDPSVVGRTVRANGQAVEIVGVLPPEYLVWGEGIDLYVSNSIANADRTNSGRWLQVIARMKDGVTSEQAHAEMRTIAAGLAEEDPGFNAGWSANVVPMKDEVVGETRSLMLVLLGAVGLLLLIACANVANLLLARGTGRQQEMAIRTSMGASRGALTSQLLLESVLLATLGTALGLLVAHYGSQAIVSAMPDAFGLPRTDAVRLSPVVLGFTVTMAVVTAFLFGLLPAMQASDVSPATVLSGEARGPGRRSGAVRNLLVVTEVAFSVVLLAGATLMARSFANLMAVDSGLDPENVVTTRVSLSGPEYRDPATRIAYYRELEAKLAGAAGVEQVGSISWLPFNGIRAGTGYWPTDRPIPPEEEQRGADILNVTGEYFDAMGIQVVRGRAFDSTDREDSMPVAIVNQTLANLYWPDEDPIGKELEFEWGGMRQVQIVGVIADVSADGLGQQIDEAIYMPMSQTPFFNWFNLVVRASTDPDAVTGLIRTAMSELDPTVPASDVRIMADLVARSVARPRVSAWLMGIFAALAAVLAAIGLYGVLSYAVARRVREIGVRVALGARPGDVLGLVATQGGRLVGLGLVLGLIGAFASMRLLESMLFGVTPNEWVSLVGSGVFVLLVGAFASVVPALRATRIAPVRALTSD